MYLNAIENKVKYNINKSCWSFFTLWQLNRQKYSSNQFFKSILFIWPSAPKSPRRRDETTMFIIIHRCLPGDTYVIPSSTQTVTMGTDEVLPWWLELWSLRWHSQRWWSAGTRQTPSPGCQLSPTAQDIKEEVYTHGRAGTHTLTHTHTHTTSVYLNLLWTANPFCSQMLTLILELSWDNHN